MPGFSAGSSAASAAESNRFAGMRELAAEQLVGMRIVIEVLRRLEHKQQALRLPFALDMFRRESVLEERARRVQQGLDGVAGGEHVALVAPPGEAEEPAEVSQHDAAAGP